MCKILIFGANGATGKVLYNYLDKSSDQLFVSDMQNIFSPNPYANYYKTDYNSFDNVNSIIKKIAPDHIYNLAGTFTNNYETDYNANTLFPKYILDSILSNNLKTRVLLIGSAAEYGMINEMDNPISEDYQLNPVSIYGLTKVFQSSLLKFYYNYFNIDAVMARTFNLLGKGISEKLFIGTLYRQIEDFKLGKIDKIKLGNPDNKRDYIKIEEAVIFYYKIMKHGKAGEIYNIGCGKSIKIYDLLKSILKENRLDMNIVEIVDSNNKKDVKDIYANIRNLNSIRGVNF